MAGGPHAAVVMCTHCTGRALRRSEGIEDDWYDCTHCGGSFGIDWSGCVPTEARWPPSRALLEEARTIAKLMGRDLSALAPHDDD